MCVVKLFLKTFLLLPVLQAVSLHFFRILCKLSVPAGVLFHSQYHSGLCMDIFDFKSSGLLTLSALTRVCSFGVKGLNSFLFSCFCLSRYVEIPILSSRHSRKTNAKGVICAGDFL